MARKATTLIHSGRDSRRQSGAVNPPIYQTSTVLFPTLESYHQAEKGMAYYEETKSGDALDHGYGIGGTPTTFALQDALKKLEGGETCAITPSGLSAITMTLLALLGSGDHALVVDTVYGPTRRFCHKTLVKLGIETTFYDPLIGEKIADLIRPNTKLIFLESPGSLTFEMQDVPAIAAAAKARGIITAMDNSWATPLFFNPLAHGVDVSIHAITKYISGHSDVILGAVIARDKEIGRRILQESRNLGNGVSPYDCYLALRGLRSMAARLEYQQRSTQQFVRWLKTRPEVARILYPADPDDPGHALWKKHYGGAASLLSAVLDKKYPPKALSAMIDKLEYFGIGCSWGGYESLILDFDPSAIRTASAWPHKNTCLRFYIGLEAPEDLIADIEKGFERLKAS